MNWNETEKLLYALPCMCGTICMCMCDYATWLLYLVTQQFCEQHRHGHGRVGSHDYISFYIYIQYTYASTHTCMFGQQ